MIVGLIILLFLTHLITLFVGVFLGATRNQERDYTDE